MTEINLLPWREHKREQEKKLFTTMSLIGIVFAAFVVFLINSYAVHLVNNQTTRNQMLQKEIASLDEQIKEIKVLKQIREGLISRMSIVQNLQSTRTLMVHLFDELIKVMPSGIYVTKLERQNDIVSVWGYSESNTNISMLMRSIENNAWIQSPVLTEIKKMDETKQAADNQFKLSFVLKPKY
ncbi:PilN domain-containing protein [Legionella quateirensis]|uniref:Tfp pilus assembly protein PilN n=1 Tax=Legionella quateirensis TaxID=45072 RepID=A0A378KYG7_9GAMM|nr:PilN domain-containing protein [Legionella quateirensis]KTD48263.1 Tfp pilus assembly protein PilN [Legionella quateirensis]STY18408.1 type IV pilus assembly protein PilN [Legionella quateirensis]